MEKEFTVKGLVAATFTPMKENGDIVYDAIDKYCQFLLDEGISQVYVNGTNGEGPSLTVEERMRVVECWVKAGSKDGRNMKIIVQVGGTCMKDSMTMARHAESHKVDAISTLPPIYFPIKTTQDLVDHCRMITAEAPNTPMYYYHIPRFTGVNMSMSGFLEAGREVMPSLRGIKFSDLDLVEMSHCLRTKDTKGRPFNILFGSDEQVLSAYAMGAEGSIGSTYNFMAGLYHRIQTLANKGDLPSARVDQYRSQDVVKELFKYGAKCNGIVPTQKAVMSMVGVDLGSTRHPMRQLGTEDTEAFRKALTDMGFFEWRK